MTDELRMGAAPERPLRVGLIGCGGNQRNAHVPRLLRCQAAGDVRLVACCDPVEDNRQALHERAGEVVAERFPAAGAVELTEYAGHQAMLAAEDLDAVVISTPHTLHCAHILDSLAAGCHVLTEKPMVCSVAEARDVIAARDRSGLLVQVGYQRHFVGGYRWAREQIRGGAAGPVRFVNAWQCQGWYRGQLRRGNSWRIQPGLSGGGQLNDSGSHLVDIVLWMTGLEPVAVSAVIDPRDLEVDVLSAVAVHCEGGAIINFSIVGDSVRGFDEEVTVWCDEATLQFTGVDAGTVRANWADAPRETVEVPPEERPEAGDPDGNFVDAILGRTALEVPAEDGLRVIALTEAAWRSAVSGQRELVER